MGTECGFSSQQLVLRIAEPPSRPRRMSVRLGPPLCSLLHLFAHFSLETKPQEELCVYWKRYDSGPLARLLLALGFRAMVALFPVVSSASLVLAAPRDGRTLGQQETGDHERLLSLEWRWLERQFQFAEE